MITLRSFSPSDFAILLTPPNMDRAAFALDGPMFDASGSEYLLLDFATGVFKQSKHPSAGITISVNPGISVAHGAAYRAGCRAAVQLYPSLVERGVVVASEGVDTGAEWRAAVAVMPGGLLAFAVGQMGMADFARELQAAGAIYAGYTDGGSSTTLATQNGRYGHPAPRQVPTWLVARGAFVPPLVGVAALMAAGGYTAWRVARGH